MVQILKRLNGLKIREGNIYAILARLQTDGLVASDSEPSRDGPPRKYFELTESGRNRLDDMNEHWRRMIEGIEAVKKGMYR